MRYSQEIPEKPNISRRVQFKMLGVDADHYLNAGVMIMDLAKMRRQGNFLNEAIEYLVRRKNFITLPDEIVFNFVFKEDIKTLSEKYNRFILNQDLSDCIVHTFKDKPWEDGFKGELHEVMYWKMYLKSAWGEHIAREDVIDLVVSLLERSQYVHKSEKQCFAKITGSLKSSMKIIFRPLVAARSWLGLLVHYAAYCLRYRLKQR